MAEFFFTKKADLDAHEADTSNPHAVTAAQAGAFSAASVLTGTNTLNFSDLLADTEEALTITVTGAALGDVVILGIPNASIIAGVLFTAHVSAADTVTVTARNVDTVARNPASGIFRATVLKA